MPLITPLLVSRLKPLGKPVAAYLPQPGTSYAERVARHFPTRAAAEAQRERAEAEARAAQEAAERAADCTILSVKLGFAASRAAASSGGSTAEIRPRAASAALKPYSPIYAAVASPPISATLPPIARCITVNRGKWPKSPGTMSIFSTSRFRPTCSKQSPAAPVRSRRSTTTPRRASRGPAG